MKIKRAEEKVMDGVDLSKGELMELVDEDLDALTAAADEIREEMCGNKFELCTIINGRSGRCSENCKYCAQSVNYNTDIEEYGLMEAGTIIKSALTNERAGVHRFSIVTSGKAMNMEEVERMCGIYRQMKKECSIKLCASHGLLGYEELVKLKEAGVERYHNNLETSRRYFKEICTTHTYDDKVRTIQDAKRAGLSVCSGGIIGLGETMEDRIDMALTLRELKVDSVPVNVLNPIKGTPLQYNRALSYEEILRTAAIFRFTLPNIQIRLAGGRSLMPDKGERAMKSGINAAISGDMLTTSGITTSDDYEMLERIGYDTGR